MSDIVECILYMSIHSVHSICNLPACLPPRRTGSTQNRFLWACQGTPLPAARSATHRARTCRAQREWLATVRMWTALHTNTHSTHRQ